MAKFGIGRRSRDDDFNPDGEDLSELNDRIDDKHGPGKWGLGCGFLFIAPFFIGGIFALITGIKGMQTGEHNAHVGVIVGSIFLLVSTITIVGLLLAGKKAKVADQKKQQHPDKPWLWRADWANNEVKCEGKVGVWFICGFAGVWNAISWGITFAFFTESPKEKAMYFVLLFPLVGLFLIWWAVYSILQHSKFGTSTFRMLANPGVLGGTLRGAVEIPAQVSPKDGFKVRLLCVHRYSSGTGDNRRTHEDTKWEEEKIIKKDILSHDRSRTGVPVFFNIPYDQPRSCESPTYIWKLQVTADIPGIDYKSEFYVPVFKTEDSDPHSQPIDDPTSAFQPDGGEYKWPQDDPIELRDSGERVEIYFPPARNKGVIAFLFIFLLLWNGAIWFMITEKAPVFFVSVFGFFDLLLLIAFFTMLFFSSRVIASPLGLQIYRRFIVPVGSTEVTPDQVSRIKVDSSMQSGDKNYYDITAVLSATETKLAGSIQNKKQAEWLADRIEDCLGIKKE
ncbi:MAG: hypothetical protein ACPGVU_16330 [Limisphaerales bacterium]